MSDKFQNSNSHKNNIKKTHDEKNRMRKKTSTRATTSASTIGIP